MCLSGCATETQKKPGAAPRDAAACDDPVAGCPLCDVGSVTLGVSKATLTLKHDCTAKLEAKLSPATLKVDSVRIEARRESGATWCKLHDGAVADPWTARIAGKFKLRAVATVCGVEHMSGEVSVEVRFPTYAEIEADAAVRTATDAEWASTLADCTERPNQRRERGFWIALDTRSNVYRAGTTVVGGWSGPADGASVPLPTRPADDPAAPTPCAAGATYRVASFHTHTPTTFRRGRSVRPIGPSGADNRIDTSDDVPGVVYDYVESPAGSGSIPMGHPKASAAQRYLSLGVNRRGTPP